VFEETEQTNYYSDSDIFPTLIMNTPTSVVYTGGTSVAVPPEFCTRPKKPSQLTNETVIIRAILTGFQPRLSHGNVEQQNPKHG